MSLESSVFAKKRVLFDQLEPFGFVREGKDFVYSECFLDGEFEAVVRVSEAGQLTGRVLDMVTGEDYLALRVERASGSYVGQVRQAYLEMLQKIADTCFLHLGLTSAQGQRLASWIQQTFSDHGAQPFAKFPKIYAFRHPANEKWYALALPLERGKLDLGQEKWSDLARKDVIEVVNIKVPPAQVASLLEQKGIYPSYHMNKKHWVSLVLDDSLTDEVVWQLVSQSRDLVGGKSSQSVTNPHFWVIPANPKYYDIDTEFRENPVIDWTQKASIKAGDYVVIYMTAPIRAIRYLCRVLEADLPNEGQRDRADIKKLMRLELLRSYPDETFSSSFLLEHGLKTVRGPRRLPQTLSAVLTESLGKES